MTTARATPEEKATGTLITDGIYNGQIIQNLLYALGFILVGDLKPAIRSADYGLTWLVCNGRTIGSGASGANLADNQLETIFKHLWATIDSSVLGILTSAGGASTKGLTAQDDWNANKRIRLLDMRGVTPIGIDGTRGMVTDAAADLMGGAGGASTVTLTTAQIPVHSHPTPSGGFTTYLMQAAGGTLAMPGAGAGLGTGANTGNNAGGGGAHNNMQPYIACNWMMFTGVTYDL